jgi:uncharacterized protein YjbJ (UPF0337 family)
MASALMGRIGIDLDDRRLIWIVLAGAEEQRSEYRLTWKQQGDSAMDWDEIERNWTKLKGEIKHEWSKLTDEDVEYVKGRYAELVGLLQERYGHAKEHALIRKCPLSRRTLEAKADHQRILKFRR